MKTGKPIVKTRKSIPLEGDDSLTPLQAKAMLKACLAVLRRFDFNPDDDTLTGGRERESLAQAASKLERSIRFREE